MEKLFEMTDDNARQAQKLENEDVLCFIIRSDIGPFKMHWIASNYYLFSIPYKGNRCLAIAYGMYKNNKISEDPNLHEVDDEIWGDVNDDDDMEAHAAGLEIVAGPHVCFDEWDCAHRFTDIDTCMEKLSEITDDFTGLPVKTTQNECREFALDSWSYTKSLEQLNEILRSYK